MTESDGKRQRNENTLNERDSVGNTPSWTHRMCPQPYERGANTQGFSQRDVERDYYMECEYKARLANGNSFYN